MQIITDCFCIAVIQTSHCFPNIPSLSQGRLLMLLFVEHAVQMLLAKLDVLSLTSWRRNYRWADSGIWCAANQFCSRGTRLSISVCLWRPVRPQSTSNRELSMMSGVYEELSHHFTHVLVLLFSDCVWLDFWLDSISWVHTVFFLFIFFSSSSYMILLSETNFRDCESFRYEF